MSSKDAISYFLSKDLRITAKDGLPLAATLYEPTAATGLTAPLCLVIINSEAGVKRSFYEPFAEHLAGRGAAVLTYDYRGIGGSLTSEIREAEASITQWGKLDAAGALDWAQQYIAKLPVFVIAHGLGGQLVGLTEEPDQANEYLFIASGLDHHLFWPKTDRMRRNWRYGVKLPMLIRTFGYLPRGSLANSTDLPAAAALRIAKWARDEDGAYGVEKTPGFEALTAPITAYSFSDDEWTSAIAAEGLLDCYPNARSVHIPLTPFRAGVEEIGHDGFFNSASEDLLWPRATEWLRREIPLVMAEREAAEAAEREAQGLPPKPTKQQIARAAKLRAIAGTEAARKAAEAAAIAEQEAAKQAAEEDENARRSSRRRGARAGRRARRSVDNAVRAAGSAVRAAVSNEGAPADATEDRRSALAERRAERAQRRAARAEAQQKDAAASTPAIAAKPSGDVDQATGMPIPNADEARRQAAAIARMAKASEQPKVPVPRGDSGGEAGAARVVGDGGTSGGTGNKSIRDQFRRVPTRRQKSVRDTDVE
ncbi:MAG: alpha/beta hydrolase [Alphaproteobacteria bacterium]|nr:alpha/beta hydrolase [Alphaproteobacteria bacterium SS10]